MLKGLIDKATGLVALLWREVMKFGVVGGIAFVIDSAIFVWMMSGPMDDSQVKAKVVAGVVATMFSWVANRYWTFRHRRRASVGRELVMFLMMNAIGLLIAAACVGVTKYWLGMTDPASLFVAGSVVGLVLGTIFRFFAYRFWVFTEELDVEPGFDHDRDLLRPTENAEQGRHEKGQHARRPAPAPRLARGHSPARHATAEPAPRVGSAPGESAAAD